MTTPQTPPIFTIRDTNARIRAVLEKETVGKPFWIAGLVRKHHISDWGHEYFELWDDDFTLRCMVRENVRGSIPFSFANGQEVEVCGTIRVYEPRAMVEFEVEDARRLESVLPRLNEDVEARLARRGLWPRDKRPLPEVIERIWLVTSQNSAARRDFENTYSEYKGAEGAIVKFKDVRIQGQDAPRQLADAINWINQEYDGDPGTIIVLTRGGGRSADLAVFSDPTVAEAICESQLFIAVGIGHEDDETFADLAADVSKGTPTAIAVYLATRGQGASQQSPLEKLAELPPITSPAYAPAEKETRRYTLTQVIEIVLAIFAMVAVLTVLAMYVF